MNVQIPVEIVRNFILPIAIFILYIIIGYILSRIVKIVVKKFVENFLGLDKALERRNIELFNRKASDFISDFSKNIVFLVFIIYSIFSLPFDIIKEFASTTLTIIYYISILIIVFLITFIIFRLVIVDLLSSINVNHRIKNGIKLFLEFVVYSTVILSSLSYLGLLNDFVKSIFLITYSSIIFSFSLAIGISLGLSLRKYVDEMLEIIFGKK